MAYKAEVIADRSGKWNANGLRFATKREAAVYVADLFQRWTLVTDTRVVKCDDAVNARMEPAGERAWRLVHLPMKIHPSVTLERVIEATRREMFGLDNPGFCIACGVEVEGVEPDARRYQCESCDERAVYGAQELFVMMAP